MRQGLLIAPPCLVNADKSRNGDITRTRTNHIRTSIQPQVAPQATPVAAQSQSPQTWDEFGSALADFLGFAEQHTLEDDLGPDGPDPNIPQEDRPYQPQMSENVLDRTNETSEISPEQRAEVFQRMAAGQGRFGSDSKTAAARVSMLPRGVVPFLAAVYDATAGDNPRGLGLSGLYRKNQFEADAATMDQPDAAAAVRQYAPLAIGGAIGALRPAKSFVGTAARGGAAGGAFGAADNYFDKDLDSEDLSSPKRIMRGLEGAVPGAVLGAGGAVMAKAGTEMYGLHQAKSARQRVETEKKDTAKRLENEKAQGEYKTQLSLANRAMSYQRPKEGGKGAEAYSQNPEQWMQQAASSGVDTAGIARSLGVSEHTAAIAIMEHAKGLKGPNARKLYNDAADVVKDVNDYRALGKQDKYWPQAELTVNEIKTTPKDRPPSFEEKAGADLRKRNQANAATLKGGLADIKARDDKLSRVAPHWKKGTFPTPVSRPAKAEPEAPKAQEAAPSTPAAAKVEAKRSYLTSAEKSMRRDLRGQTRLGRETRAEVQETTRKAQGRADAQTLGDLYRPSRDVLDRAGAIKAYPIKPEPKAAGAGKTITQSKAPQPKYSPESKRGVLEIADEVAQKSGKSLREMPKASVEEFVSLTARHTNMRPSEVQRILKSYGQSSEGKTMRAKRGIGARRIREIMEGERSQPKGKKPE